MSTALTRRKILAAAASALPAVALAAVPALVGPPAGGPDAALLALWAEYLAHGRADAAAEAACNRARVAFDAAMPPCPPDVLPGHHWGAMQPLRDQYGIDPLYDAWSEAGSKVSATIAAILATPAEGLVGIGVKLAALPLVELPEASDLADAIKSAVQDITRLTGVDFPLTSLDFPSVTDISDEPA